MYLKKPYRLIAMFALVVMGGCAQYTPSTSIAEVPAANSSYLYGRFSNEARSKPLALDGYMTMGFKITCDDGESYTVRFSKEPAYQLIKIKPSKCSFTEIVYTDADGRIRSRKDPPHGAFYHEEFVAGRAYYLGDYWASVSSERIGMMIHTNWRVHTALDDYYATTQSVKNMYPNFVNVPTERRLLATTSNAPRSNTGRSTANTDLQCYVDCKRKEPSPEACRQLCAVKE
jgi:hypothetical protein